VTGYTLGGGLELAVRATKRAIGGRPAGQAGHRPGDRAVHLPGLLATEDRRAGMPNLVENGAGKATSTGR
jgi:hypothetical protein